MKTASPLDGNGCYYPDLWLSEGTHNNIGKYGLMGWEHLQTNCRRKYLQLLLNGKLNEYLYEVDGQHEPLVSEKLFAPKNKRGRSSVAIYGEEEP